MSALSYDIARCTGQQCPSAEVCRRYKERRVPKGVIAHFAALHARRNENEIACDGFIPIEKVESDAAHVAARIIHANPAEV